MDRQIAKGGSVVSRARQAQERKTENSHRKDVKGTDFPERRDQEPTSKQHFKINIPLQPGKQAAESKVG